MKDSVDIENAGIVPRGDYGDILCQIGSEGLCPFCQENLHRHHTKPTLRTGTHWLVTENFKPYDGARYHFLIISIKHVERIEDLTPGAGEELLEHYRFLSEQYQFPGATIVWRSGETAMTGASVKHLHFQIIVGGLRTESADTITALVGFKSP